MGRRRKSPGLRICRGKYWCADIYSPDGKRTTVAFGTTDDHKESEIMVTFGKWLDLYSQHPHKVLTFGDPYEAVSEMINPSGSVTVGDLLDRYQSYAAKTIRPVESNKEHPDDSYYNHKPEMLKRDAKSVPANIERHVFAETRITAYRLKAAA